MPTSIVERIKDLGGIFISMIEIKVIGIALRSELKRTRFQKQQLKDKIKLGC